MAQPNIFGLTEFEQDPQTAADLMRLRRQQQIADAMYGQSQQPLQGQMVGQVYVPPSITQGLAKLFQGYSAGRQSADVMDQYKKLAADRRAMEDTERGKIIDVMSGRPDGQRMYGAGGNQDEQSGMGFEAGAPAGSKEQVMQALMASRLPAYRDAGLKAMLADKMAKPDRTVVPAGASLVEGGKAVYTAPFKPTHENSSNLSKLIAERDEIAKANPNDPAIKTYNNAIRKASEIPKQIVPSISVNGVEQGKESFDDDVVNFYANQALMTGDQSWRTGLGRSKDGVKLIIAVDKRIPKLAKEVGMTPEQASNNKQEFAVRSKALKDFSTGTQGQMVNSFNTAINHLDTLRDLGTALKNGNVQVVNKAANTVAEWLGNADVTNLDTAKQIVGAEVIKAIVARGGGVAEREEAASRISRISSPDQLIGYIKTQQELMAGQLLSLEKQYEQTTKRKDFKDKLLPKSKKILSEIAPIGEVGTSATQSSMPISSQIPGHNANALSLDAYLKSQGF